MTEDRPFQSIADRIRVLETNGIAPRFWLRDDDAVDVTTALERLLQLTAKHHVPVALAIIPARSGALLADYLNQRLLVTPVIHGWFHDNHAPPDKKKQELGLHRPAAAVIADLQSARQRMEDLYGDRLFPMLVPPWNRIDAALIPELPGLGYTALSTFGDKTGTAPLPILNSNIDLMDWRGTRGGVAHEKLIQQILERLGNPDLRSKPIGILAHHLVHDETAWSFLEKLFLVTAGRWFSAPALVGEANAAA